MKPQKASDEISRSYKNFYPFRLATTSFIYPDTWVPNVHRLGPFLDEIELLLLDRGSDNYPSAYEIRELARLADELEFTYNIHLPMDIFIGHKDALERKNSVDEVKELLELTSQLPVSINIIHAVWMEKEINEAAVTKWRDRVRESFENLIASGIEAPTIAVETLDYPLGWLDPVIFDLNLSVCLDLGHLWLAGKDPLELYNTYKKQTRVLHLHGVEKDNDHLSLVKLDAERRRCVKQILRDFKGVVSLEVFSFKALESSLTTLETICQD